MNKEITASFPKYQCIVSELEKTKQENEHLKKALGELVVERQIRRVFISQKKSLKR